MDQLSLVIGNKNYSSWSLRPWLLLRYFGIPFEEIYIPLYVPGSVNRIVEFSPSRLVPALKDGDLTVWDSLAICEYLNERFPTLGMWPKDPAKRAIARSISAEMHSGFSALRQAMSMNIRARRPDRGRTSESLADVDRIIGIWNDCRARNQTEGPFLFGQFTIADAMFAPVVLRFQTYEVPLEGEVRRYADTILALPAMQEWIAASVTEKDRIEMFEDD